jgi:hypothetical protein
LAARIDDASDSLSTQRIASRGVRPCSVSGLLVLLGSLDDRK